MTSKPAINHLHLSTLQDGQLSVRVRGMPSAPILIPHELAKVRDDLAAALALDNAPEDFDVDAWLQEWLHHPQPALGGALPMDLLNSGGEIEQVVRLLGSLMSNSYQ